MTISKAVHRPPNRVNSSWGKNWKTVPDFLHGYCRLVLGKQWYDAERAKPIGERHPIIEWDHAVGAFYMRHSQGLANGDLFSTIATGPVMAHLALSYDIYVMEHHGFLSPAFLDRLKDRHLFQGARYEAYVVASFIRAGFEITPEDEKDRTSTHCEFVAWHGSGRRFSVEAKSRHREGILGRPGTSPPPEDIVADVASLLARALRKHAAHDRIVFIDVNVPPQRGPLLESDWFKRAARQLQRLERQTVAPVPPAFVFFTNQPYHYVATEAPEPGRSIVFTAIHIPDFKQPDGDETSASQRSRLIVEKYPRVKMLYDSLLSHSAIPQHFE